MDDGDRFTLIKRRLSEGGSQREHAEGDESHSLSHITSLRVQTFKSFNRFALFNPPPKSSPASRERTEVEVERFEQLEPFELFRFIAAAAAPRRQSV